MTVSSSCEGRTELQKTFTTEPKLRIIELSVWHRLVYYYCGYSGLELLQLG